MGMAWNKDFMIIIIINNLRYADDTTLLAESKEELLQLVTSVKEKSWML